MKISTAIVAAFISAPATVAFTSVQSNSRCSTCLNYIDPTESDGLWAPTQKNTNEKEAAVTTDAATSEEVANIMKSVDEAVSMMNSITVQSALSVPETKQASSTEIDTAVLQELARKLSIEIDPAELEDIFLSTGENPTRTASPIEKKVTLEEKIRLWNETYHQFSDSIQSKEDLIRVAHEITAYASNKITNPNEDAVEEFFSAWKKFSSGAIDFTFDSVEAAVETVQSPEFKQKTADVASNLVSFLGKQKLEIPLLQAGAKDVTTSAVQTEEDQEKQRLAYFESVSKNVSPATSMVVEETTDEDEKIKQRLAYFESVRARVAAEEKVSVDSNDFIQEPKPIFSNNYLDGLN